MSSSTTASITAGDNDRREELWCDLSWSPTIILSRDELTGDFHILKSDLMGTVDRSDSGGEQKQEDNENQNGTEEVKQQGRMMSDTTEIASSTDTTL